MCLVAQSICLTMDRCGGTNVDQPLLYRVATRVCATSTCLAIGTHAPAQCTVVEALKERSDRMHDSDNIIQWCTYCMVATAWCYVRGCCMPCAVASSAQQLCIVTRCCSTLRQQNQPTDWPDMVQVGQVGGCLIALPEQRWTVHNCWQRRDGTAEGQHHIRAQHSTAEQSRSAPSRIR